MKNDQIISAHSKWILTGEHTVMRGGSALVFPLPQYQLKLHCQTHNHLIIQDDAHNANLQTYFKETLSYGCDLLGEDVRQITGILTVQNTIPIRAGLGSSAALSVVIGKFLEHFFGSSSNLQGPAFYQRIEDKFHRMSSGVDIVGVQAHQGMCYHRVHGTQNLNIAWRPNLYLSFSEQTALTYDCIERVQQLYRQSRLQAQFIDQRMSESVQICLDALRSADPNQGFDLLKMGIEQAGRCFQEWGIASIATLNQLQAMGAVAAKPTGSGKGAYISLWKDTPPPSFQGIALFT